MNIEDRHAAIKPHVSGILKYYKFLIGNNFGIMRCFCKELIPLFYISLPSFP